MKNKSKLNQKVSVLYLIFAALFIASILISNIAAQKQLQFFQWNMPGGIIVFPISYIMSDVVAEVYGFKATRRIIWLGFSMNLLMVVIFAITSAWPAPAWFEGSEAYAHVVSSTPRLLIAGLTSYLVGSWANAVILSKMKVAAYNGKGLKSFSARAVISTIAGETLDSALFIPIAFLGVLPLSVLPSMIVVQVLFKTTYEIIILPFTNMLVKKVKQVEGLDTLDKGESYGLF